MRSLALARPPRADGGRRCQDDRLERKRWTIYFPVPPKTHFAAQVGWCASGTITLARCREFLTGFTMLGCIAHQNGLVIALTARPEAG